MLVTIPVCWKDEALVLKNLSWLDRLGAPYPQRALVTHDSSYDATKIVDEAKRRFADVFVCRYPEWKGIADWPQPQNWAWQMTAKHIEREKLGPWLWWEADATPLREGWVQILEDEYQRGGQPFMGYLVEEYDGHMNGVGVYPQDISHYLRDALLVRQVAFDIAGKSEMVKHAHRANHLIQWTPEPVTFTEAIGINPSACLYHKCKDGTLIDVLAKKNGTVQRVVDAAKALVTKTYYHSGNLGDIIYALYAIRKHGKGKLLIGPEQLSTSPCAVPITQSQYENLAPLLEAQPYITSSEFAPHHPRTKSVVDLNTFRNAWNDQALRTRTGIHTLCGMHCHILSVPFDPADTWLSAPGAIRTDMFTCHRSARYRNDKFPWAMVVKHFAGRLLFVGLPQEHAEFCRAYGKIAYWCPSNFLELARVIAGSLGFIGNQSFPCSLALGLGQRVLQESWPPSADCVFPRANFLTQPFTKDQLTLWETMYAS